MSKVVFVIRDIDIISVNSVSEYKTVIPVHLSQTDIAITQEDRQIECIKATDTEPAIHYCIASHVKEELKPFFVEKNEFNSLRDSFINAHKHLDHFKESYRIAFAELTEKKNILSAFQRAGFFKRLTYLFTGRI